MSRYRSTTAVCGYRERTWLAAWSVAVQQTREQYSLSLPLGPGWSTPSIWRLPTQWMNAIARGTLPSIFSSPPVGPSGSSIRWNWGSVTTRGDWPYPYSPW